MKSMLTLSCTDMNPSQHTKINQHKPSGGHLSEVPPTLDTIIEVQLEETKKEQNTIAL